MMIVELLLTIFAWRKGWGPRALLPAAIGIPLGVMAAAGSHSLAPAVMADVLICIALVAMLAAKRQANTPPQVHPLSQEPKSPAITQQPAA